MTFFDPKLRMRAGRGRLCERAAFGVFAYLCSSHFAFAAERASEAPEPGATQAARAGDAVVLETAGMRRSTPLPGIGPTSPNGFPQFRTYLQNVVTIEVRAKLVFRSWLMEWALPAVVHGAELSGPMTPQLPNPRRGAELLIGNPTLSGLWKVPGSPVSLGSGIALPLGGDYMDPEDLGAEIETAQTIAEAVHAGWSVWRYRVDSTGAFALARADVDDERFGIAAEAAGGVLAGRDVEPVLQLGATGSVALGIARAGGHLRQVWLPGSDRGENYLVSFEPWVSIEIPPLTFVVGQLFRLDEADRPPDAVDSIWRPRFAARFDW